MSAKLHLHADTTIPLVQFGKDPVVSVKVELDIAAEDEEAMALAIMMKAFVPPPPPVPELSPDDLVEIVEEPQEKTRFNQLEVD